MPRSVPILICVTAFAHAAPPALRAQTVTGVVLDDVSDRPLPDTPVLLLDSLDAVVKRAASDSLGRFLLPVPGRGRYRLFTDRPGYGTLESQVMLLAVGDTLDVELRLSPVPAALEGITVSVDQTREWLTDRGFYRRRERSLGYFIEPEEIAERHPSRVTDLLRGIPGLLLKPHSQGIGYVPVSMRMSWRLHGCPMKLVVDGDPVAAPDATIDEYVNIGEVIGVEVYPGAGGAGGPVQYRTADAFCGLILVWTH